MSILQSNSVQPSLAIATFIRVLVLSTAVLYYLFFWLIFNFDSTYFLSLTFLIPTSFS